MLVITLGSGPIKFRGFSKAGIFDPLMVGGDHERSVYADTQATGADQAGFSVIARG